MTAPAFDVLTMGRVSVDLYPDQSGATLAEVRTFAKSFGGSPTNVAVAASRLGRATPLVAARLACADAMPTEAEVLRLERPS